MGLLSTIGKIGGAVVGGLVAGPQGAIAGYQTGGRIGGAIEGDKKGKAPSGVMSQRGSSLSPAAAMAPALMRPTTREEKEGELRAAQVYQGSNPWDMATSVNSWFNPEA